MAGRTTREIVAWQSRPATAATAVILTCDATALPFAAFLADQIDRIETCRAFDIVIGLTDAAPVPPPLAGMAVRFCHLDAGTRLDGLPVTRSISRATYMRLLLCDAFADDYDRILYLDSDLFLARPGLGGLLSGDDVPHVVSAAPDVAAFHADGPVTPATLYRNAGVLLIDAARARREATFDHVLAHARENAASLRQHDQSALNGALAGRMGLLSPVWNWPDIPALRPHQTAADPVLLHFVSHPKPWVWTEGDGRMRHFDAYADYLQRTFGTRLPKDGSGGDGKLWNRLNRQNRRYANPVLEWIDYQVCRFNLSRKRPAPPRPVDPSRVAALLAAAEI